jgi:prepilin-type N-terminal cleavage/methylation domain-containing protein
MKKSLGYTLIEVLVAMIIFAIIASATGFAVSMALKSQHGIRLRTDELQEARTVLNVITRDLRSAYASAGNQNTLFLAGGNESGTLLTFTTLAHRIVDPNRGNATTQTDQVQANPQSDIAIVQYSFAPETGTLSRLESAIPNPDTLVQSDRPDSVLSRHVRTVTFQFLVDPTTGFRQEWNYITPQPSQTGTQTGAAGAGVTAAASTTTQTNGDTTLPQSVQVLIEFIDSEGIPRQYSTVVMLPATQPQPIGQKPDAAIVPLQPTPTGGGPGGDGPGGGGAGGGGGGNPRPGAGGGGGMLPVVPSVGSRP